MYIVGRAINGVCINGKEYLLNDGGKIKKFKKKGDIYKLFKDLGISKKIVKEYLLIEKE